MSLRSLLKRVGMALLLFGFIFSISGVPAAVAQEPPPAPASDQAPQESERSIDEQLQVPFFSDIVNCEANGEVIAGGNGDGLTAAAPNLKDPAILAEAINAYIAANKSDSPFAGLGNHFVAGAMRAGINPIAVLYHAQAENNFGTDTQQPQVREAFNAFGRTATSSQPHIVGPTGILWYKYDSWQESVDGGGVKEDHPTYIRERYIDTGQYDINTLDYIRLYAPESDGNDTEGYIRNMRELMRQFKEELAPGAYADSGAPPGQTAPAPDSATPQQPTIVIDPGHSGSDIAGNDPATGLYDFDYANRPEITDVFEVSQKMKTDLEGSGYKVIMTKDSAEGTVSLRGRANVANAAHASLAISVHTDGAKSFADFKELYVQKVGLYRGEGDKKVTFDNAEVAQKSQTYAEAIRQERDSIEGGTTVITDNPFNGRAPLEPGNIPMIQLFATIPWVYSEVGSGPDNNGLTAEQKTLYARSLVAGIKNAVPAGAAKSDGTCVRTNGAVQGNVVQTALNLAWDTEIGEARGIGKDDAKPEYQRAFQEFYVDMGGDLGSNPYSDCGVFVGVVMRASGADPDYKLRMTGTQQDYMRTSGKYEVITNPTFDDLRPGDIINYDVNNSRGHTLIYTGDTGDGYLIADASLNSHVPERGTMTNITWMFSQPNVVIARVR